MNPTIPDESLDFVWCRSETNIFRANWSSSTGFGRHESRNRSTTDRFSKSNDKSKRDLCWTISSSAEAISHRISFRSNGLKFGSEEENPLETRLRRWTVRRKRDFARQHEFACRPAKLFHILSSSFWNEKWRKSNRKFATKRFLLLTNRVRIKSNVLEERRSRSSWSCRVIGRRTEFLSI